MYRSDMYMLVLRYVFVYIYMCMYIYIYIYKHEIFCWYTNVSFYGIMFLFHGCNRIVIFKAVKIY